jgi:hypothetical protein
MKSNSKNEIKKCLNCQAVLSGRVGKKYCDNYCKSNHFYEKNKTKDQSFFKSIDLQLKKNRRILKEYNKAGKATVREEVLLAEGFNPKFFTHFWRNQEGKAYLFCYEYGFLKLTENNKSKFVLVKWQGYMT